MKDRNGKELKVGDFVVILGIEYNTTVLKPGIVTKIKSDRWGREVSETYVAKMGKDCRPEKVTLPSRISIPDKIMIVSPEGWEPEFKEVLLERSREVELSNSVSSVKVARIRS